MSKLIEFLKKEKEKCEFTIQGCEEYLEVHYNKIQELKNLIRESHNSIEYFEEAIAFAEVIKEFEKKES